ncbi:MAG: hypothetical protein ABSG12_10325 [Steroidobacteraceae bacterium]|jgi:hypothetical protein
MAQALPEMQTQNLATSSRQCLDRAFQLGICRFPLDLILRAQCVGEISQPRRIVRHAAI